MNTVRVFCLFVCLFGSGLPAFAQSPDEEPVVVHEVKILMEDGAAISCRYPGTIYSQIILYTGFWGLVSGDPDCLSSFQVLNLGNFNLPGKNIDLSKLTSSQKLVIDEWNKLIKKYQEKYQLP